MNSKFIINLSKLQVILSSTTLTDKSVEYKFLEPWLGESNKPFKNL